MPTLEFDRRRVFDGNEREEIMVGESQGFQKHPLFVANPTFSWQARQLIESLLFLWWIFYLLVLGLSVWLVFLLVGQRSQKGG